MKSIILVASALAAGGPREAIELPMVKNHAPTARIPVQSSAQPREIECRTRESYADYAAVLAGVRAAETQGRSERVKAELGHLTQLEVGRRHDLHQLASAGMTARAAMENADAQAASSVSESSSKVSTADAAWITEFSKGVAATSAAAFPALAQVQTAIIQGATGTPSGVSAPGGGGKPTQPSGAPKASRTRAPAQVQSLSQPIAIPSETSAATDITSTLPNSQQQESPYDLACFGSIGLGTLAGAQFGPWGMAGGGLSGALVSSDCRQLASPSRWADNMHRNGWIQTKSQPTYDWRTDPRRPPGMLIPADGVVNLP